MLWPRCIGVIVNLDDVGGRLLRGGRLVIMEFDGILLPLLALVVLFADVFLELGEVQLVVRTFLVKPIRPDAPRAVRPGHYAH